MLSVLVINVFAQPPQGAFKPNPANWENPTGLYKVVMEVDETLPNFTIYRPVNLEKFPKKDQLPIVIMSGPGCNLDGSSFRPYWTKII